MSFKSGFVTIIGKPNVGKSTLLNCLAGEKIAITSSKPQTTRNTIKSIITKSDYQIVFIDTPGLHKPKTKLGEYMMKSAMNTFNEVDTILYLVDSFNDKPSEDDLEIFENLKNTKTPVILIINKIDTLQAKEKILKIINNFSSAFAFKAIIPISAKTGECVENLTTEILKIIPKGPMYFPEDTITDQMERTLVSEMIREKMLILLDDEVPHGIGVEIDSFKEKPEKNIVEIRATIFCEKDSHKGIIIGKQGKMLKKIASEARVECENLLGTKVFLEVWVKVKSDWRNNMGMLKNLGYYDK